MTCIQVKDEVTEDDSKRTMVSIFILLMLSGCVKEKGIDCKKIGWYNHQRGLVWKIKGDGGIHEKEAGRVFLDAALIKKVNAKNNRLRFHLSKYELRIANKLGYGREGQTFMNSYKHCLEVTTS